MSKHREWVLKNCKFAAWYDPRTWGTQTQSNPISKEEWERKQFESPEDEWQQAQFETPEEWISEEQQASRQVVENLSELLPNMLNNLEAIRIVLQRYGFGRYEKSLNEIIRIVETIQKLHPEMKKDKSFLRPRERRTMEEKGLLDPLPKIASKDMTTIAFDVLKTKISLLKAKVSQNKQIVARLEAVEKLIG